MTKELHKLVNSEKYREAIAPLAKLLEWGKIEILIQDGKVKITEIKVTIKH